MPNFSDLWGAARIGSSRPTSPKGYFGEIPKGVFEVLAACVEDPPSVASNFSRAFIIEVGFAASLGWITLVNTDAKTFSRTWKITREGLTALETRTKT
jgi:hypothetical protein